MIDVRSFTVGPIQENAYIVRASADATRAVIVDPGEEAPRLLEAARSLGVEIEAILVTHCHFDHIGAVAPVAKETGAPVYCPEMEAPVLADVMKWTMPGFGPFESWSAERTVKGGERMELAGMEVEVLFSPGHSPGHVTYAISHTTTGAGAAAGMTADAATGKAADAATGMTAGAAAGMAEDAGSEAGEPRVALLSGDVLFQGSVGRVDLPGGDWPTLERSIAELMERFARETPVYPGHMGATTLGRELDTNPFLSGLRAAVSRQPAAERTAS